MKSGIITKMVLTLMVGAGSLACMAQEVKTYEFARRGNDTLFVDVYTPPAMRHDSACIIYIFGGGFIGGSRNEEANVSYCQKLAEAGFTVAAIDYRLGLKGVTKVNVFHTEVLENAIHIAVEDTYSATIFMLNNADKFKISKDKIILCGSSAGAMTALQSDYHRANGDNNFIDALPTGFRYAGIVAFSGAIFSREGKIKWRQDTPAPTLMFHGTEDRLVTYNKIQFFRMGLFGANALAKRFEKYDYPYFVFRVLDHGHDVAVMMEPEIEQTIWFIDNYITNGRNLQIDQTFCDADAETYNFSSFRPNDLYNPKDKE